MLPMLPWQDKYGSKTAEAALTTRAAFLFPACRLIPNPGWPGDAAMNRGKLAHRAGVPTTESRPSQFGCGGHILG